MIVLSRNLVLELTASPEGLSPNAPILAWQNIVRFDTISADYEQGDHPATNMSNESMILWWESSSLEDQYITVLASSDTPVDYVAIAKHNLGSSGAQLTVEALTDEDTWEVVVEAFVLPDDSPSIIRFVPVTTTGIRIHIQNPSDFPRIAILYSGLLTRLPRNIYVGHTPINYGRHTEVTSGKNEAGDFLGRIVTRRSKNTQVVMSNIPPDWFRTDFEPFMTFAEEFPFFFAWRPRDYPMEVGFVWTTDDIMSSNEQANGFMEFQMTLAGIARRAGVPMVPRETPWTLDTGLWSNLGVWRTDRTW